MRTSFVAAVSLESKIKKWGLDFIDFGPPFASNGPWTSLRVFLKNKLKNLWKKRFHHFKNTQTP